jgi:hypothetical protein
MVVEPAPSLLYHHRWCRLDTDADITQFWWPFRDIVPVYHLVRYREELKDTGVMFVEMRVLFILENTVYSGFRSGAY